MTRVLLIYPYFKPRRDRSVFRFPPLGIGYIAASMINAGYDVRLLDCTFMDKVSALNIAFEARADAVGIYCMITMQEDCLWFARQLRSTTQILIAGGPLPTCEPAPFLDDFDVVVRGEGEKTMVEVVQAHFSGLDLTTIRGIALKSNESFPEDNHVRVTFTPERPFIEDLDRLPFPARHLLPNKDYIQFGKKKYGYSITSVMSTRGCPYQCDFCSNVIFGGSFRQRSASNVVDEIEQALALGYDRISFSDDVFTLHQDRLQEICAEIDRRHLQFFWECLARVDSQDESIYKTMYRAGCRRVYFGIESGDDRVLKIMNKHITVAQAERAVLAASQAGLEVGAFFILFYPGETRQTTLTTLRFAASLPLDYLGLTMPYPIPGTKLYERVKSQIKREWNSGESIFGSHVLIYNSQFSESLMWFGIIKGHIQFYFKRHLGKAAPFFLTPFEIISDWLFFRL